MSRPSPTHLVLFGLAAFVVVSRCLFLTSSTNMWDSPSYVRMVKELMASGTIQLFTTLEMGHSLYVQICALGVWLSRALGGPEDILWSMKIVGIVLTASSIWPFYWLARWLLGTSRLGLLACAFYVVVPLLWWWSGEIMSDAAGLAILVWAFGLLARWLEGRSVSQLALACLVFGANPLVRFSNLSALPLFLLLVAIGLWRRRRLGPALWILLIPVPVVAAAGIELWLHPFRPVSDLFAMTPQNEMDWSRALTLERWATVGHLLKVSLGTVGAVVTPLGVLAALVHNRRLLAFAFLWTVPFVLPQVVLPVSVVRYWLPVVPVAALATAELIRLIVRLPRGRILAVVAASALTAGFVIHALPNLHALHERESVLDAVPRWYAAQTEPGSLLITGAEHNHALLLVPERDLLFLVPDVYEMPWIRGIACAVPETIWRVDRALARNRRAFVSSLVDKRHLDVLAHYYDLEEVVRLPGDGLRNRFDLGFGFMDERLRLAKDVLLFGLRRKTAWPRGAAPPTLSARSDRADGTLTARVDCLEGAGCLCMPVLCETPAALDWTREEFGRDRFIEAGIRTWWQDRIRLDRRGRGQVEIEIPRLGGVRSGETYAGYCLFDREGVPRFISVPARLRQ